jgi:predicted metal-dependent enzyme (double-stranded beta helix superfamily)
MFDVQTFVNDCQDAINEPEPRRAVRESLRRALRAPSRVGDALQPRRGGITLLHHASDLTVIHAVWAPGMRLFPHDHRMWAVIGIYAGQEDNEFFRRPEPAARTLVDSGGKRIGEGEVLVLGDDVIHAVRNPLDRLTAAIHVYGGDFVNQVRSQWGPGPVEERPYDMDTVHRQFAEANAAWDASRERIRS